MPPVHALMTQLLLRICMLIAWHGCASHKPRRADDVRQVANIDVCHLQFANCNRHANLCRSSIELKLKITTTNGPDARLSMTKRIEAERNAAQRSSVEPHSCPSRATADATEHALLTRLSMLC
eukprot:139974-Chlamydomonas_euryale.AAC.3